MLNSIAYKYCYADIKLFKKLKIYFIHAAGDKIRLWSFNLATSKLYVLNLQRSSKIPIHAKDSQENLTAIVNMMWELKDAVAKSCSVIESIMEDRTDLKEFLGETLNLKLPSACAFDIDDIKLSSSPLRPASVYSDNDGSIADDDDSSDNSRDGDYTGV
ncbi:hypothetical protein BDF21DRAFT_394702 [Thamnidium elegans]|nr:hypothetical protein BDF21DRAFT_394702 [Thamnidium elegans]